MSYDYNSFVNKNEADALKDMIFKRISERSKTLADDVRSDVMDLAKESFVDKSNPFSLNTITDTKPAETPSEETEKEIGFPQRKEIPDIARQNRLLNEEIIHNTIQNNMIEAREALSDKKSFMGALNFLNSQAAVSLIRTRADKFEAII